MPGKRCWNCNDVGENVISLLSGITYCAACGAVLQGAGDVSDLAALKTEPGAGALPRDTAPQNRKK
jgi:hypothetical protein